MGSVLRRETQVVASLASESIGVSHSRAESSRGVLLGCYFRLVLPMVIFIISVPRLVLERRCRRRRRVAVVAFVIVVRGDVDLVGAASPRKEKKYDPLKVHPLVGPTPNRCIRTK